MEELNLMTNGLDISITIKEADLRVYSEQLIESTMNRVKLEMETNPSEVYYSINKVCSILGVDRTTLHRWGKRSYLKSIKIGGKIRYRRSDIDKLLNQGQ